MADRIDFSKTCNLSAKKRLLSINDTAETLQISRPMVYQLIHQEGFPAFRLGNRWRVSADGLDRWIAEQSGEAVSNG